MTDEINSELKKWDVHFRGSDKVLCVEADMSPHQAIAQASFQADWLKMRDGGMVNLEHVLAIVPHIEPADATAEIGTRRLCLRDADGDVWLPIEGTDSYVLRSNGLVRTCKYIEQSYGPVTEVSASDAGIGS
jgi:hypothetical protein